MSCLELLQVFQSHGLWSLRGKQSSIDLRRGLKGTTGSPERARRWLGPRRLSSGRSMKSLHKEVGCHARTIGGLGSPIANRQADLNSGKRTHGLTTEAKTELVRLRREYARLTEEWEILLKSRGRVCSGTRRDAQEAFCHSLKRTGQASNIMCAI